MSFLLKDQLVEEGYLSRSTFQNLVLYNYTDKCTYEKKWTKETLESRGTIYDNDTGLVVARAFDKFFNLGEFTSTIENLPALPFDVEDKEDGSLGILYQFPGKTQWRAATRGSFYSDQAAMAEIILEQYNMAPWPVGWTPLVEIIYPENRIILDYAGESKLVLLAARNIETGRYMHKRDLDSVARSCGFPRPKSNVKTIEALIECAQTLPATHEGWVVTYVNGFKVKIKGARYLELARFKANLSPLTIWEVMMQGVPAIQEFMTKVPEEFEKEAQAIYGTLKDQLLAMVSGAESRVVALDIAPPASVVDSAPYFKEKSLLIQKEPEWTRGYLFERMRKGGQASVNTLLKQLRPTAGVFVDLTKIIG